ncbi:MAG: hypothetical protein K2N41_05280 [Lachnospiraceae bacterium]|nr:hypothetical protein [Lachnospiraceae bacterium]
MKRIKQILKNVLPVFAVIIVICIGYLIKPLLTQNTPEEDVSAAAEDLIMSSAATGEPVTEEPVMTVEQTDPPLPQEELTDQDLLPEPEQPEEKTVAVLSYAPLALCDLYAERGTTAAFQCFYDGAEEYRWEYYDITVRNWAEIEDVQSGYDDLGRQVSCVNVEASNENNGIMIRCRISFPDMDVTITETACLYVLDKSVRGVTVGDLYTDAQKYIYIHMIPVTVTYEDGTAEEITGLSGLHFLETEVKNVEEGVSLAGNPIETVTTVITETDYQYFDYGANEVNLRYHPAELSEKKIDIAATFSGTDQNPPVISHVDFSDYKISSGADSVEVLVTIMAEDDITPYPFLQYAILPKGQEPTEADWRNRNCFKKEFDQNGTWIIYCRDQYGNIGSYEKNIIVSDSDAPEIASVTLEKEGWYSSNTIRVQASDALSLTYSYSCAETGEDSGFIARNEYEITSNGTWIVRVMDAAGNLSTEQIYVSSIDTQNPVINGITTQKEEQ